ncbi:unnamed protein product [Amoebophrya sp. A120]|nr:unnamed protein product [Amoebophrya sp. A120]|eukprot:GSA120T00005920001.1
MSPHTFRMQYSDSVPRRCASSSSSRSSGLGERGTEARASICDGTAKKRRPWAVAHHLFGLSGRPCRTKSILQRRGMQNWIAVDGREDQKRRGRVRVYSVGEPRPGSSRDQSSASVLVAWFWTRIWTQLVPPSIWLPYSFAHKNNRSRIRGLVRCWKCVASLTFFLFLFLPLHLLPTTTLAQIQVIRFPSSSGHGAPYLGGIFDLFRTPPHMRQVSNFYTPELTLNSEPWNALLKSKHMVAVLFFSPVCVYSQALQPIWDQVAHKMERKVPVVRVDLTNQEMEAMKKYKLQGYPGYPVVRLIVEDENKVDMFEYEPKGWQTTMETITSWLSKHLSTGHEVHSLEEFRNFHFQNPLFVVGLFEDDTPVDAPTSSDNPAATTASDSTLSPQQQTDNRHNVQTFQEASKHFENVLFAESRKSGVSREIANYLREHHHLKCEVVNFGASKENTKAVETPNKENMRCRGPKNLQRPEWNDSFEVTSNKTHVTAKRTDQNSGWDQGLQYSCCLEYNPQGEAPLELKIPSVTMFTPFDEQVYTFPADHSSHINVVELIEFVHKYRQSLITDFNVNTMNEVLESASSAELPLLMLIHNEEDSGSTSDDGTGAQSAQMAKLAEVEETVRKFAKEMKGRVLCSKALKSGDDPAYKFLFEMLDLSAVKDFPVLRLMTRNREARSRASAVLKYKLGGNNDGEVAPTVDNLRGLLESFEQKTARPYLKSEPAPDPAYKDEYDPVEVFVGSTLHDGIANRKTDIFLNIYAPWCGHSKRLQPVWRDLATRLRGNEQVVTIAKIDGTANETPDIPVMGYPTMLFFKAGQSGFSSIEYNGPRTTDALLEWLKKHSPGEIKPDQVIPAAESGYDAGRGHSDEI